MNCINEDFNYKKHNLNFMWNVASHTNYAYYHH